MSTQPIVQESRPSGEVRYEVSASGDAVNLRFEKDGTEVSFSIDHRDASLLASDIRTAVDKTHENTAGQSEFIFD